MTHRPLFLAPVVSHTAHTVKHPIALHHLRMDEGWLLPCMPFGRMHLGASASATYTHACPRMRWRHARRTSAPSEGSHCHKLDSQLCRLVFRRSSLQPLSFAPCVEPTIRQQLSRAAPIHEAMAPAMRKERQGFKPSPGPFSFSLKLFRKMLGG